MAAGASLTHAQSTNTAPLSLFINGGGTVAPLTNAQLLVVGQSYNMVATPRNGYLFSNWQAVNVFTSTSYATDTNGNKIPVVSTTVLPSPVFTNQPSLDFIARPVSVIFNTPGIRTVTRSSGWQVNFQPVALNVQRSDSALVLTWPTNLTGFTLQSTTNLAAETWAASLPAPVVLNGQYTVTNPISGPRQFFRLGN